MKNSIALAFALLAILSFSSTAFANQLDILNITEATTIPQKIYPGDLITVTFNVENISGGGQVADDVKVEALLNSNDFTAVKASEELGTIGAKNSEAVSLRFAAKSSVLPGVYRIPIAISYLNETTRLVHNGEIILDLSSCTLLKIDDIVLSSQTPHIGDTLNITAKITNACSTFARNVIVELKPVTDSTVAPFIVSQGTTQKIGDINPMGSGTVTFSMLLSDKVEAKTYVFALDANCDDCQSNFANRFSFLAYGRPELVFSNIEYSVDTALGGSDKQIMQGSTFTLSVQIDNIGQEKAKGVEVAVDFNGAVIGGTKSFLGNINPDDSGAAVFDLTANYDAAPGENPGKITVTYTDELGQKQQFTEDYPLYVNAQPPTSPVVYIFILIFLIVALALVYFIMRFIFRQLAIRKAQR